MNLNHYYVTLIINSLYHDGDDYTDDFLYLVDAREGTAGIIETINHIVETMKFPCEEEYDYCLNAVKSYLRKRKNNGR